MKADFKTLKMKMIQIRIPIVDTPPEGFSLNDGLMGMGVSNHIREITLEFDVENGTHVATRIEEKVTRLMRETGLETNLVVIDAKSYLDLKFYCSTNVGSALNPDYDADFIMLSSVGPLSFIVSPQETTRIQVLGSNQSSIFRYITRQNPNV